MSAAPEVPVGARPGMAPAVRAFHEVVAAAADVTVGAVDLHEAQGCQGAFPARIAPLVPESVLVGAAFPVRTRAGDNLWLHRAIAAAPVGSALVVAVNQVQDAGYWGEVMAEAALARGIVGLVIDGQVRDRDRLVALGFPVFCTGLAIRGTVKDPASPGSCGEPVVIGEAVVRTGDLVYGDHDGVVVVAQRAAATIARKAVERKRREVGIIERLRNGETSMEVYGLPQRAVT